MRLRSAGIPLFLSLVAVSAAQRATAPPAPLPGPTTAGSAVTALALPGAPPDGVALDYLAVDRARHRVWVPAGGTGSTDVIDTKTQEIRRVEKFPTIDMERREGGPEGFALVYSHGFFYTNVEDKDRTVRIAAPTRKVTAPWMPACGEGGPRGLAIDTGGQLLMVACPDHVEVLSALADGKI